MVDKTSINSGLVACYDYTPGAPTEPMTIHTAERFLSSQIPLRIQRLFPHKLKLAYEAVDQIFAAHPWLQIPTARDNRGRLISWAVDWVIKGLIESGEWPVDYRWQLFAQPTGHYLEVILPHSTMSISQVKFWQEQPRSVVFRENARLSNRQMDFWKPTDEDDGEEGARGPLSLLMVHGYKDLEFAHIGIPHQHHHHGYIYQTPNLLGLLHVAPAPDVPPPEAAVDIDELLTLKADIEKWQRDNRTK